MNRPRRGRTTTSGSSRLNPNGPIAPGETKELTLKMTSPVLQR